MNKIFEKAMELEGMITKMSGACDVISIEVNTAMQQLQESKRLLENERVHDKYFADRYFELVEDLAKYGIIQKEWGSE